MGPLSPCLSPHPGEAPPRLSSAVAWKAAVLALLLAEATLFGLHFGLDRIAGILRACFIENWPGIDGIRILACVVLGAACAALLFGRSYPAPTFQRLTGPLRLCGRPIPFLLVHLPLLLALVWLTAVVLEELYSEHALRYVVGWLAVALATLTVSFTPLLPAGFWVGLLRYGFEALVAVAIAGVIVCVGLLSHPLWWYLNQSTLWGVHGLLGLFYPHVVYEPGMDSVGTASYTVEVTCPCGGAEGIGLNLLFLALYLWLFRHSLRFPSVFLLLPLGTALMWLLNVARITALVALGTWNSPAVDVQGFHSQAGWLVLIGVSLGLVALSRRVRCFSAEDASPLLSPSSRAAAYLTPLLALMTVMMLSRVCAGALDWLYPLRVLLVGGVLWFCRRQYTDLRWTWSWSAAALGVGVFLLWIGLEPHATGNADVSLKAAVAGLPTGWAVAWLAFRVVGSVVTVPLAEELAFRGYLTRRLITTDFQRLPPGSFTWLSCLASSVLFGAMHGRWLAGTLAGLAYALALYKRGELSHAVQAHAITNGLLAAYVLTTGAWSFWVY